jgi:hypothetical protein
VFYGVFVWGLEIPFAPAAILEFWS